MRDLNEKKVLQHQTNIASGRKGHRNQERVIYSNAFFSQDPPKSNATLSKEDAEWRTLFAMTILILFSVVMILITVIGDYGMLASSKIKTKKQHLIAEIEELKKHEVSLGREIDALRHNVEYIEYLARKELSLAHPNEKIYFLPPEMRLPEATPTFSLPSYAPPPSSP